MLVYTVLSCLMMVLIWKSMSYVKLITSDAEIRGESYSNTTTMHHNHFTALFLGPPR